MGTMSQALCHDLTDKIAGRIVAILDGYERTLSVLRTSGAGAIEPFGLEASSLFETIDASGDPELETALGETLLNYDRAVVGNNVRTLLSYVLSEPKLRAMHSSISSFVKSSAGGEFDSFRDYLTDRNAYVTALYAELARSLEGESAFTSGGEVTGVLPPSYEGEPFARVYIGADGSLTDVTTEAADVTTADVSDLWASDNDSVYVLSKRQFGRLGVCFSTPASSSLDFEFYYYAGSSGWVQLTDDDNNLVDGTENGTQSGIVSFDIPSGWTPVAQDASGNSFPSYEPLYVLQIKRTANSVETTPVATWFRCYGAPYVNLGDRHLGINQPPLGLIVVSSGPTVTVTSLNSVEYLRFSCPGSSNVGSIRLRAVTPTSGTITWSAWSYVNQSGTSRTGQATGLGNSGGALAAGDYYPAASTPALNASDTGIRSILTSNWTLSGVAAGEIFEICVVPARTPIL